MIFDTYMEDSIEANEAVIKTGGGGSLLGDPFWFSSGDKYGVGFQFSTVSGGLTMRAVSQKCVNKGPADGRRRLDGNRVTPNGDNLDWSF